MTPDSQEMTPLAFGAIVLIVIIIALLISATFDDVAEAARREEREKQEEEHERVRKEMAAAAWQREWDLKVERKKLKRERENALAVRDQALEAVALIERQARESFSAPEAEAIVRAVEDARLVQQRRGRGIVVNVLACFEGIFLEWVVEDQGARVPEVIATCNGERLFKEYQFTGRHGDRLPPGRHTIAFRVHSGDGPRRKGKDLQFVVYVPSRPTKAKSKPWKERMEEVAADFVERGKTMAETKERISTELARLNCSPEEIEVQLSQFEVACEDGSDEE